MPTYVRVVEADARLAHQIVLCMKTGNTRMTVSCNCMPLIRRGPTAIRKPMMTFASGTDSSEMLQAWRMSKQHRTHIAVFNDDAIAKARAGTGYRLT